MNAKKKRDLIPLGVSAFFIAVLLAYMLWKPDPVGTLFFLVLPLPLNVIIFLRSLRVIWNGD